MPRKYYNAGSAGRGWGHLGVQSTIDTNPDVVALIEIYDNAGTAGLCLNRRQCEDLASLLAELAHGGAQALPMIEGEA